MTPARIRRAAEVLREEAYELHLSHTVGGEWPEDDKADDDELQARIDHDEMIALAAELDAHAIDQERTPRFIRDLKLGRL